MSNKDLCDLGLLAPAPGLSGGTPADASLN